MKIKISKGRIRQHGVKGLFLGVHGQDFFNLRGYSTTLDTYHNVSLEGFTTRDALLAAAIIIIPAWLRGIGREADARTFEEAAK